MSGNLKPESVAVFTGMCIIAKTFAENAVKFTFKTKIKFRPIYEILIECMANTENHASSTTEEKYNWWLFEYCDKDSHISYFTFIDLGVGIFESINVRWYKKFTQLLGVENNEQIMRDILDGKAQSRTGKSERGKGLPLIYKHSKNKHIKNFYIISNNIKANIEQDKIIRMQKSFSGTFLYWELHPIDKGGQLELWSE